MDAGFSELLFIGFLPSQKHVIPSHVYSGQIGWSVLGSEDKVLSGRSEQISLTDGVASTYACANCCPNVIYGVYVNPISLTTVVNSVAQFTATQTEQNCYNQQFGPYQAYPDQWNSFNYGVATIDYFGNFEAVGVGDTSIQGCVERTIWYNWGGGYCEPFTDLMCDAAPVEVFTLTVDINPSEVRPSGTGGTVTATVTVSTNPATSGQSVTLFVVSRNDGGHVAHTGTRPLGSFGNSQGTTGADGKFSTTYTASDFGGGVDIIARLGTYETLKYLEVRVANLGLIATTNDWNLVGETTTHPVNHYGTAGTNVSLAAIARDYNDQYYGVGQFPPDASKLRFNDMALINGGKFDLTNNWSTTAAHQEHRLGLNCDFYSGNVPTARWTFLTGRFVARGSPNYVDETQALNHWHLRFSE